jgi:hypothetical protein
LPAELGTLELISSQNQSVRLLEISDAANHGCDTARFMELNVDSLEELSFDYVENRDAGSIMDLALRSSQQQMTLKWMSHTLDIAQFQHQLIWRIVSLQITVGQ